MCVCLALNQELTLLSLNSSWFQAVTLSSFDNWYLWLFSVAMTHWVEKETTVYYLYPIILLFPSKVKQKKNFSILFCTTWFEVVHEQKRFSNSCTHYIIYSINPETFFLGGKVKEMSHIWENALKRQVILLWLEISGTWKIFCQLLKEILGLIAWK